MDLIEKRRRLGFTFYILAFLLFAAILILLIFTREAWIDESWFAAYAIHFLRTGEIADLNMARFTNVLPHNYFFYFYALLQAPFYYLFGETLIVGRMITVFAAFIGLWAMYQNYRQYLKLESAIALFSTFVVAFTYYYVYPATQIRPDLIAVVFVLTGMVFLKRWIDRQGPLWLILTHMMFILAILLHLQAGFAWVGLWFFLLFNTLKIEDRLKTVGTSLPVYIFIGLLFFFNEHFGANLHHYYETFFGSGNMAGHKGGMIMSMVKKFHEGEFLKLGIRLGMLTLFVINFLYYIYLRKLKVFLNDAFFLVAGASFGSWLLTTTQINDYHAVWLTMPFMLMAYNMFQKNKFFSFTNALFFVLLIAATFAYTFKTVKTYPLKTQTSQIHRLNDKYGLGEKKVFIDRDLMWFYGFGRNATYRLYDAKAMPDFLLLRKEVHKKKPFREFENKKYRLVDETSKFLLYEKDE